MTICAFTGYGHSWQLYGILASCMISGQGHIFFFSGGGQNYSSCCCDTEFVRRGVIVLFDLYITTSVFQATWPGGCPGLRSNLMYDSKLIAIIEAFNQRLPLAECYISGNRCCRSPKRVPAKTSVSCNRTRTSLFSTILHCYHRHATMGYNPSFLTRTSTTPFLPRYRFS